MAEKVERLPSKVEVLSSNPSTQKTADPVSLITLPCFIIVINLILEIVFFLLAYFFMVYLRPPGCSSVRTETLSDSLLAVFLGPSRLSVHNE
jgi:hypothetical protein